MEKTISINSYHGTLFDFQANLFGAKLRTFAQRNNAGYTVVTDDNFAAAENKEDDSKKNIVFVSHPFDMILSSYRHHAVTNEVHWARNKYEDLDAETHKFLTQRAALTKTFDECAEMSYKEILQCLETEKSGLLFEILGCSRYTCDQFTKDYVKHKNDSNYLFVKVENFLSREGFQEVCEEMSAFLGVTAESREAFESFLGKFLEISDPPPTGRRAHKFLKVFEKIHYDTIEWALPSGIVGTVDYS